jgi:hypothetical protein
VAVVAGVVQKIVLEILETDDEGQLCFGILREGPKNDSVKEPLLTLCKDYIELRNRVYLQALNGGAPLGAKAEGAAKPGAVPVPGAGTPVPGLLGAPPPAGTPVPSPSPVTPLSVRPLKMS